MRATRVLSAGLALALGVAAVGCAPKTMIVLSKYGDRPTGGMVVSTQAGSVDVSTENQATTVKSATSAPTPPASVDPAQVKRVFGPALAVEPAPPQHFVLNFAFDSATLTPESEGRLPAIVAEIRRLGSEVVSVVGHSDTSGDRDYNLKLSQQRADAVKHRLVEMGVAEATIEVAFHGSAVPLVQTGDNVKDERNRRVEVVVR